jgi:hypothetical protein
MKTVDQEGRKMCQEIYHITTNGTITVVDHSVFALWCLITVSNTGNGAKISITNRETPPKAVIPPVTLADPGSDAAGQMFNPNPQRYFWMEGGINIVTTGTTSGTVDVWLTYSDEQ